MIALAATLALLAADPTEVVVQNGETLAQVAQRTVGDPQAAPELRALNALPSDEVKPGTTLKLPGPGRALALSALSAARHAVEQADPKAAGREEAGHRLTEAEELFHAARYTEAAKAADQAWQLVSTSAHEPTRFQVEVAENGKTTVLARSGQPVRVEAEGVTRPVYAGQTATVEKGHPPELQGPGTPTALTSSVEATPPGKVKPKPPPGPLTAPVPSLPMEGTVLTLKVGPKGLGPVRVAWTPVAGASAYEVELWNEAEKKPLVVKALAAESKLPPLPVGRYRWAVRALGAEGARSPESERRTFELAAEPLKLDVKETKWK